MYALISCCAYSLYSSLLNNVSKLELLFSEADTIALDNADWSFDKVAAASTGLVVDEVVLFVPFDAFRYDGNGLSKAVLSWNYSVSIKFNKQYDKK